MTDIQTIEHPIEWLLFTDEIQKVTHFFWGRLHVHIASYENFLEKLFTKFRIFLVADLSVLQWSLAIQANAAVCMHK